MQTGLDVWNVFKAVMEHDHVIGALHLLETAAIQVRSSVELTVDGHERVDAGHCVRPERPRA